MVPGFVIDPAVRLVRFVRARLRPPRWIEGLPNGLAFDVLDGLCREHLRAPLSDCAYVHLSSWKSRGTYRLRLSSKAGVSWNLIFKDELYSSDDIPALRGLPIRPGPPEFAIYHRSDAELSRFLPRVYSSREVVPGRHYQYLLEDLGQAGFHRIRNDRRHLLWATEALVDLQGVLKSTLGVAPPRCLAVYDRQYSTGMLEYARRNLQEYRARDAEGRVGELCSNWKQLVQVHARDEFYEHRLHSPIHGDYNRSNLHIHARERSKIRVVDWEWSGIGVPHADLAALLKFARPADERAVLELFARSNRDLDLEGHRRLLRWCQLERRLLDAAFLARQQLESARPVRWLEDDIRTAAADVLRVLKVLKAPPRRRVA